MFFLSFRHILRGSQLASVSLGSRKPAFEPQLCSCHSVTWSRYQPSSSPVVKRDQQECPRHWAVECDVTHTAHLPGHCPAHRPLGLTAAGCGLIRRPVWVVEPLSACPPRGAVPGGAFSFPCALTAPGGMGARPTFLSESGGAGPAGRDPTAQGAATNR